MYNWMEKFQHHLNLSPTPDVSFSCRTQHTRRRLCPLLHTGEDFSHCRTQHAGEDFTQCRTQHAGEDFCPLLYTACRRRLATVAHSMQERTSPNVAHSTGCSGRSLIGHHTPQKPVTLAETFLWSLTSRRPLLMTQVMLLSKHRESTAEKQPVWPALFLPLCVRSSQHDLPPSFVCQEQLAWTAPFHALCQEQPAWTTLFHPLCDRSSQLDLLSSILCVTEAANLTCSLPSFVWQKQPVWPALFHPLCDRSSQLDLLSSIPSFVWRKVLISPPSPTRKHKPYYQTNQMWCTKSLSKYTQTVHFPHNSCYFQQFSFAWRKEKPLWSPNTGVLQWTVEPTNNK